MKNRRIASCGWVQALAMATSVSLGFAQPDEVQTPPAPPAAPATAQIAATFATRLEALSPENPEAYFLLGEEVLDQAADESGRKLAVTLFVLAAEMDRVKAGGRVAASACLALSRTTRAGADRRWLTALARSLDPAQAPPEWTRPTPPTSVDSEAYKVASAIGFVRSGDGGRARQLLGKPEVRAALLRYDTLLSRVGAGTASMIIREADRWPCPECANQRAVKRGRADKIETRLCPICGGNPGPRLSRDSLLAQLRFESWILQGVQRSWGAQIVTDSGAPLLDPDPSGLAMVFEVDARAVYWRNGRWCRSADGSDPAQPDIPIAKPRPKPQQEPSSTPGSSSGS
ncbi:hypothetical protein PHYC_03715 [Phycisphaerales bacterium]|nr:hypothetical protein PHYC_03715 [Phycisphaerales bacterium]